MCINWMFSHYGNSYIMLSKNVSRAITSSHKLEIFSHDYHNGTLAPLILKNVKIFKSYSFQRTNFYQGIKAIILKYSRITYFWHGILKINWLFGRHVLKLPSCYGILNPPWSWNCFILIISDPMELWVK